MCGSACFPSSTGEFNIKEGKLIRIPGVCSLFVSYNIRSFQALDGTIKYVFQEMNYGLTILHIVARG